MRSSAVVAHPIRLFVVTSRFFSLFLFVERDETHLLVARLAQVARRLESSSDLTDTLVRLEAKRRSSAPVSYFCNLTSAQLRSVSG